MTFTHEISKIYPEELFQTKYNVITHLIWLKIQNMMDINVDLLQQFMHLLIKCLRVMLLKTKSCQTSVVQTQLAQLKSTTVRENQQKNCTKQSLENLRNVKYTHILKISSKYGLISKVNKGFQFILCAIDSQRKYAWLFL